MRTGISSEQRGGRQEEKQEEERTRRETSERVDWEEEGWVTNTPHSEGLGKSFALTNKCKWDSRRTREGKQGGGIKRQTERKGEGGEEEEENQKWNRISTILACPCLETPPSLFHREREREQLLSHC